MAFEWNLPDLTALKVMVSDAAVTTRDAAERTEHVWSLIVKLGVAGLQAAPYNLAADAAQDFYDKANMLHTNAAIYYGQAAQPDPFDFDDALAIVRAGT